VYKRQRWNFVIHYAESLIRQYEHLPIEKTMGILRSRILTFMSGFHRARSLRNQVARCKSLDTLKEIRDEHLEAWAAYEKRRAEKWAKASESP